MRIVQHKAPNPERAAKSDPVEVIGLSQNNPLEVNVAPSTSPTQKTIMLESSQVAHAMKPAAAVPHKTANHINQPRKY